MLDYATALIPVLNVSLAVQAIIADSITGGRLAVVYLSLTAFAGLSLYGCAYLFDREEMIFSGE